MRYLAIFFLVQVSSQSISQDLRFFKERLSFTISESEFTVDGFYCFRNTTRDTLKQYMVYPFPTNPELGKIKSIVGNSEYPEIKAPVLVGFDQEAATFRLMVFPFDTALIHITYIHSITNNQAEYILTSTKAWNRPLEKADFILKIPANLVIDSLSYNADSLLIKDGFLFYKFMFLDFMPDKDFAVFFKNYTKAL